MNTVTDAWGIVLAGGLSRRFGRDKAMEKLAGEPLLHGVIRRLSQVAAATVVVINDKARAEKLSLGTEIKTTVDIYPNNGSLGGIFTGLNAIGSDWGIVVACDMPFLNVDLLRHLLSCREGFHAVVPVIDDHPEPTHAVYSRECLQYIETQLKTGNLKIANVFHELRVNYVSQIDVEKFDHHHLSFFNVNTRQDFDRAMLLTGER